MSKKVKITGRYVADHFGFELDAIYEVVPAPADQQHFKNDVWFFSEKRKESVRLFGSEYETVKDNKVKK
jgi:hypothetical protein